MEIRGSWTLSKIGGIFPKQLDQEIKTKDKELEQKIIKLYNLMSNNVNNDIWTMDDYRYFRNGISFLNIEEFLKAYSFILSLVKLEKDDLTNYYKEIDKKFELYIYNDETNIPSLKETPLIINGLFSKLRKLNSIIFNDYQPLESNLKKYEDRILDLELLLESLENNDSDMINYIIEKYNSFICLAEDNIYLKEFLTLPLSELVDNNIKVIKRKIKDYSLFIRSHTTIDEYKRERDKKSNKIRKIGEH